MFKKYTKIICNKKMAMFPVLFTLGVWIFGCTFDSRENYEGPSKNSLIPSDPSKSCVEAKRNMPVGFVPVVDEFKTGCFGIWKPFSMPNVIDIEAYNDSPPEEIAFGDERIVRLQASNSLIVRPAFSKHLLLISSHDSTSNTELLRYAYGLIDLFADQNEENLLILGELVEQFCCLDPPEKSKATIGRFDFEVLGGPIDPRSFFSPSPKEVPIDTTSELNISPWVGSKSDGRPFAVVQCGEPVVIEAEPGLALNTFIVQLGTLLPLMNEALPCVVTGVVPIQCLDQPGDPVACDEETEQERHLF